MNSVYVTDMETISPLAVSAQDHFEAVLKGASGSESITRFDARTFPTRFACEVTGDMSGLKRQLPADLLEMVRYDRKAELYFCCLALLRNRVTPYLGDVPKDRLGVYVGTGLEVPAIDYLGNELLTDVDRGLDEFCRQNREIPYFNKLLNPSDTITLYTASLFGAAGPRQTHLSACAASANALGAAFQAIRSGQCDAAIVGGVDSTIHPFILTAFSLLDMISTRNDSPKTASRPFDVTRDGFVPGEGAGVVVLANQTLAEKWGAKARVAGYGSSLDAYKITAPHSEGVGAKLAMERALGCAGWAPDTIDYVNAHGTSTPLNDPAECAALTDLFGDAIERVVVSSTKSQIGHLIAAGGIVEFITVVAALEAQRYPPSINVTRLDPKCRIRLPSDASNVEEPVKIERALSNSFALAGQNATLAVCTT